jgi:hypothetical protein
MFRRDPVLHSLVSAAAIVLAAGLAGCHRATSAEKAAAPITEKNVAARGGLEAWRAVKRMSLSGNLDAGTPRDPVKLAATYTRTRKEMKAAARAALLHGGDADAAKPVLLPFVMELERPHKTRLEIQFRGQTAVQVFDGTRGWKLRPFLGRHEVEPYTPEEMRVASQDAELDGLLIDHAAKGNRIELEGTEPVEGRDAYKLKVTLPDGQVRHVWVDAQTYLDVKVDGIRRMDGKPRPVWTYLRDYRPVQGLMIPHLMETAVDGVKGSEKIRVEKVALNAPIDDDHFAKPN